MKAIISVLGNDKPGIIAEISGCLYRYNVNILDITHEREERHTDIGHCLVHITLETRNPQHVDDIDMELRAHGYELLHE